MEIPVAADKLLVLLVLV